MAFNPFHHFRRYSKVVFALLAILCMFTFVLSSGMGRGDWFTQIGDWASGRGGSTAVISVGGRNFDARDVEGVRIQRALASAYMDEAVARSQANIVKRVNEGIEKLDPGTKGIVQSIVRAKILMSFMPNMQQEYMNILRNAAMYDSFLVRFIEQAQKENRTDDVKVIAGVRSLILQDVRQFGRQRGEGYFGGNLDDRNLQHTADFLTWLHEADRLGIKLKEDDIKQAIATETLGELKAEDAKAIVTSLRERYPIANLYAALGEELRARIAQTSLAGVPTRTRTAVPAYLTPEEEWELYKDARTTIGVGLITIPVDSFLGKVEGTPGDDELKKLFDKYKNEEPAPFRELPGFKEPRRVQIEWVSGKPDATYYQKAAGDLGPVFQAMRMMALANPIDAALAPLARDAELYRYFMPDRLHVETPWTENFFPKVHDTSVVRAESYATLVGAALGGFGTGAPILSAPLTWEGNIVTKEAQERAKLGLTMLASGMSDPFAPSAAAIALQPPPLGLNVLRRSLREKAKADLAAGLIGEDFAAFQKKVIELGKEKDKGPLTKFVNEVIASRGWFRGATTEPRDAFNLGDDGGMVALKDVYLKSQSARDPLAIEFGGMFMLDPAQMGGVTTYNPQQFMKSPTDDAKETKYFFWLTEDREARVPRFDKAKPQVLEAWRRRKARELAQKEAERLKDKAKEAQGDVAKLRDLAVQNGDRKFFELGPMAQYMPVPNATPGAARQYQTPTISQEKIAWAGRDLLNALMNLRKDPKGAVAIVSDIPKAHYYVSSLLARDEPHPDEFRKSYVDSMARAIEKDYILDDLTREARLKYRADLLKELRELAKVKINKDAPQSRKDSEPSDG